MLCKEPASAVHNVHKNLGLDNPRLLLNHSTLMIIYVKDVYAKPHECFTPGSKVAMRRAGTLASADGVAAAAQALHPLPRSAIGI